MLNKLNFFLIYALNNNKLKPYYLLITIRQLYIKISQCDSDNVFFSI